MAIIQPLLSVRDVSASITFYTQHLGFTLTDDLLPGKNGEPVFAGVKHGVTTLWLDNTEYANQPQNTPFGVGVDLYVSLDDDADIDLLYAQLKSAGVKVVQELRDEFWGDRRFVINDPDGYRLSIAKAGRGVSTEEMSEHTRQS